MSNDFKPAPRIKNALDNKKLMLQAPAPNTEERARKRASLSFRLVKNNPRFIVYTNDPTDQNKKYGQITANFDLVNFYTFLDEALKVINGPNGGKVKVKNKNTAWYGGKPSEEPVLMSEVHVIKDAEGICYISVIDCEHKERPRIKFEFEPMDKFHEFIHPDGTPYSKAEYSVTFANSFIKIIDRMMATLAVDNYEEPPPPKTKDGGNKGGYNNNRNNKADMEMEDDIPF